MKVSNTRSAMDVRLQLHVECLHITDDVHLARITQSMVPVIEGDAEPRLPGAVDVMTKTAKIQSVAFVTTANLERIKLGYLPRTHFEPLALSVLVPMEVVNGRTEYVVDLNPWKALMSDKPTEGCLVARQVTIQSKDPSGRENGSRSFLSIMDVTGKLLPKSLALFGLEEKIAALPSIDSRTGIVASLLDRGDVQSSLLYSRGETPEAYAGRVAANLGGRTTPARAPMLSWTPMDTAAWDNLIREQRMATPADEAGAQRRQHVDVQVFPR